MAIYAPDTVGNYAPKSDMPEGVHIVKVTKVEDLGMVPKSAELLAKERKERTDKGFNPDTVATSSPKIRITYHNEAGQFVSKEYTLSKHDKAALKIDSLVLLGKKANEALPDKFDFETLVGLKAQATIVEGIGRQSGNPYTKLGLLSKLPPLFAAPQPAVAEEEEDEFIPFQ